MFANRMTGLLLICTALLVPIAAPCQPVSTATPAASPKSAPTARQQHVRDEGAKVMPFALEQTIHSFDKTDRGGIQRVRVRRADPDQVAMIRSHLQSIAKAFAERDFSAPTHVHGAGMPGLAQMKAAPAGELTVTYRELDDGAELTYTGTSAQTIDAIHAWFDAQLADHGRDATTTAPAVRLDAFAWLAGTWIIVDGDTRTEEIWTTPSADLMLGMSRAVRGGTTISFEFMRIAARDDGVFYIAQPRGKPPVEFALASWDGKAAVFVNAGSSDRLKRIVYRNDGGGAMTARIEGANDGKEFSEDYRYRRQRSMRVD